MKRFKPLLTMAHTLKSFYAIIHNGSSQGQNMAVTVLIVPCSLGSGVVRDPALASGSGTIDASMQAPATVTALTSFSDTMHLLVSFRTSNPPQNRQLAGYYY